MLESGNDVAAPSAYWALQSLATHHVLGPAIHMIHMFAHQSQQRVATFVHFSAQWTGVICTIIFCIFRLDHRQGTVTLPLPAAPAVLHLPLRTVKLM
jgi:hypothetical protein